MWWLLVVILGAALAMDVLDGAPLKLATTAWLFVGALIAALRPPPRSVVARAAMLACLAAGIGLVLYRVATRTL